MEPSTVEEVLALIRKQPGNAALYQQLGDLHFKSGDFTAAWEALMQSLRLNPSDPWTCVKFGTLLTICDDKHYARLLFDQAIKLDPALAVAHWCSANLHRKQGEYEQAEKAYERAVEVDPSDDEAREKLTEWRSFIAAVRGANAAPATTDPGAAADGNA